MLAYWYNAPRHIKLIFIIVVCAAVYVANQVQPLSPIHTVLSLIFGFGLHVGHYLNTYISKANQYKKGFELLYIVYLIILPIILITMLPTQNKWILAIQALGFVLVGFFLISIYQNRAKRF